MAFIFGEKRILDPQEEKYIRGSIVSELPTRKIGKAYLWSSSTVQILIEGELKKNISFKILKDYLNRWGINTHHIDRKARLFYPHEKNCQGSSFTLSQVVEMARNEKAGVFWYGDGILSDGDIVHRGITRPGCEPVVLKNHVVKKTPLFILSAFNINRRHHWMVVDKPITIKWFILFLDQLMKEQKGKRIILLVMENSTTTSVKVKWWLKRQDGQAKLFYFPE
jgi:hypothetical protein